MAVQTKLCLSWRSDIMHKQRQQELSLLLLMHCISHSKGILCWESKHFAHTPTAVPEYFYCLRSLEKGFALSLSVIFCQVLWWCIPLLLGLHYDIRVTKMLISQQILNGMCLGFLPSMWCYISLKSIPFSPFHQTQTVKENSFSALYSIECLRRDLQSSILVRAQT